MDTVTNAATIRTSMDRALLDAFADGDLSPEDAARVVLHLADCAGDQAYVDSVMETNALLAAAYGEPLHQALPERLRATIFPADLPEGSVARPSGRRLAGPPGWTAWSALAASVALAFGLAVGLAPGRDPAGAIVALPGADGALRAALEISPSGQRPETQDGAQITLVASFRSGDGRPCRQFEVADTAAMTLIQGVACRDQGGDWAAEIAVAGRLAAPEPREGGFVPASGEGDDALEATLDRLDAGMFLTSDEERGLIATGWAG